MKKNLRFIGLVAVLALGVLIVVSGCNKAEKQSASKAAAEKTQDTHKTQMVGGSGMSAEGLAFVYTADSLYHCSHHSYIISDKSGTCSECGMTLTQMSNDDVAQLRTSQPKGCPMCDIIVPGNSEMTKCPKCGMQLVEVPGGEHS